MPAAPAQYLPLVGTERTLGVLAVQPRQIELKLQTSKAISETQLWHVPFDAAFYQYGYQQVLARERAKAQEFNKLAAVFASDRPLTKARNLHLQGRFENEDQKKVESLIGELSGDASKRVGLSRRDYMRTSMGMATCFLAANRVYGDYWDVAAEEAGREQIERDPKNPRLLITVHGAGYKVVDPD